MPIETKRFDLGGGDSAELYVELLHGTTRKVQAIYRPYLGRPEVQEVLNSEMPEDEKVRALYKLVGDSADIAGATDLLLLGQVKEWSFGPVTQENLDGITEKKREKLVLEANALYGDLPLPIGGGKS